MRSDVQQVVVERPKGGRTWQKKNARGKNVVLDVAGELIDGKADHAPPKHQKHRNARYNVLERFLLNRAGKVWDKVYSEACEVADARTFQGAEVRDVILGLVATKCWMEGRTAMHYDCIGHVVPVKGLYVHPKSGLLLRQPKPSAN